MLQANPAYELVKERLETREIETHLRLTILHGPDGDPIEGELVSIGRDKMLVRCAELPAPGMLVTLHFRVLSRRVCEARGQVTWSRDGSFGVAFSSVNEALGRSIDELASLTPNLRQIYLADILYPRIELNPAAE